MPHIDKEGYVRIPKEEYDRMSKEIEKVEGEGEVKPLGYPCEDCKYRGIECRYIPEDSDMEDDILFGSDSCNKFTPRIEIITNAKTIDVLRKEVKALIKQRDEWEFRAVQAEAAIRDNKQVVVAPTGERIGEDRCQVVLEAMRP